MKAGIGERSVNTATQGESAISTANSVPNVITDRVRLKT